MITEIHTLEEIQGDNFIIFKHSITCPVSRKAMNEVEKFSKINNMLSIYQNTVQTDPQLKLSIANHFSVKHESPQIIFVKKDDAKTSISHFNITVEKLTEIMNELNL